MPIPLSRTVNENVFPPGEEPPPLARGSVSGFLKTRQGLFRL